MIDGVNWRAVLAAVKAKQKFRGLSPDLVGGYDDGPVSQWPAQAWADLKAAGLVDRQLVGITVLGSGAAAMKARVDDAEPGNNDPAGAAAWARRKRNTGAWPVIYTMRDWKHRVLTECGNRGLRVSLDFGLWIATLDGTTRDLDGSDLTQQPGMVAVQVEQAASPLHVAGQPLDLDVSIVCSTAWRAAKTPPPPPKEMRGRVVWEDLSSRVVVSVDGGKTMS